MKMDKEKRKMKALKIIALQLVFLILVGIGLWILYPKADVKISGEVVKVKSDNAELIVIADNPEFENPRYIDLSKVKEIELKLKPGVYYWKPENQLISGWKRKIIVKEEVGMKIDRKENDTRLVNIGNVKINITREKGGRMVGHIILEPDESSKIEDKGKYIGRKAD